MAEFFLSIAAFVVAIGVLVAVHEYGHFWVARRLGVKVLRYSIGFGRPLLRRQRGETEYVIAAIPLGGYVRMLDEREGPVPADQAHRAFNNQPLGVRAAVVLAGPVANFLLAILLYALVFMIGVTGTRPVVGEVEPGTPAAVAGLAEGDEITRVGGRETPTWQAARVALVDAGLDGGRIPLAVVGEGGGQRRLVLDLGGEPLLRENGDALEKLGLQPWRPDLPPTIMQVESGRPAARAGLREGDRILSVDGRPPGDVQTFIDTVQAHPGEVLSLRVERDGKLLGIELTPAPRDTEAGTRGHIGAAIGVEIPESLRERMLVTERKGPLAALATGAGKTREMSWLTLRVLGGMVTGKASLENLSGPVTIATFAGKTAATGLVSFLGFLAVISLSLGIVNLLPVPVLDGGHLLYYLIEAVKGSPLSAEAEMLGQRIGLAIIVTLMTLALYNDFIRLFN